MLALASCGGDDYDNGDDAPDDVLNDYDHCIEDTDYNDDYETNGVTYELDYTESDGEYEYDTESEDDYNDEPLAEEHSLEPPIPVALTNPVVRWVVEPIWQFDAVFDFSEGMAAVEYYDRDGEVVFWDYEHILGYINRLGEIVIPVEFRHWPGFYSHRGAPPFSHGRVALQSNEHGGVGIFDTYGNIVVPFEFADAWIFSEGLMAVRERSVQSEDGTWTHGLWGYINVYGELVIPFQFGYAVPFNEGLAAVFYNGLWGFIDQTGELIIPHQFHFLQGQADSFFVPVFSEGLAAVNIGERWDEMLWGYIDQSGYMVIPAVFRDAQNFRGGIASVFCLESNQRRYIDTSGNFVSEEYARAAQRALEPVPPLLSRYFVDGMWGFVDQDGNVVVPIEFSEVRDFSEGLAWVRQGRFWGLIEIVDYS